MQTEFKLKRIIPVFIGLIFLWSIFLLSKFMLETKANTNQNYVPANRSWMVCIDGKLLLESAAYDVVYKSGNEDIFRQLETLSKRNKGKIRDAGIDFFSDVIVFGQTYQNTSLTGILLNLSNASHFEENMPEMILKNQAFARKGEVGIILIDPSKTISPKALKAQAERLLTVSNKSVDAQKLQVPAPNFLRAEWKTFAGINSGAFQATLNDSELNLSGKFKTNQSFISPYTLKPEGFHVSMCVFNQQMQDSLRQILNSNGFHLPDLMRISANYRGTNLENGAAPMADLLLEFESDIDLNQLYANEESWRQLGILPADFATSALKYGNISYTMKIVNKRTVFIGQNPSNLQHVKNENLFLLKGDLTKLTSIEGGGLIGMGINLYPPYRAGKDFFESVALANIQVSPQKGKYILNGKIRFKENQYPISETLKLFLTISEGL